ncbi:MAG: hypothetical protein GXP46_03965 [Deferribacteres bacterium]|nr:hypothetical protein [Deferribacteres bacterium]
MPKKPASPLLDALVIIYSKRIVFMAPGELLHLEELKGLDLPTHHDLHDERQLADLHKEVVRYLAAIGIMSPAGVLL